MRAGAHHDTGDSQHPSPESGKLASVATRTCGLGPQPDQSTEVFSWAACVADGGSRLEDGNHPSSLLGETKFHDSMPA
jgi:hypothetical protein